MKIQHRQTRRNRGGMLAEGFQFTILTAGEDDTFTLPLYDGGTYSFKVDWGDGSKDTITAFDDAAVTHTYEDSGATTYTVVITGDLTGWRFNDGGDAALMREVSSWGGINFGDTNGAFYGCADLTVVVVAEDAPDMTGVTTLENTFRDCAALTNVPGIGDWDISAVTDMTNMLNGATLDMSAYNALLVGWEAQAQQSDVTFHGGSSVYGTTAAVTARAALVTDGWTITDGGFGWYLRRVEIVLEPDISDEDLSDFPILLYLSASSGVGDDDISFIFDELTSNDNRKKISVTLADEETQCYVEIERWDDASEKAWLWVKVPTISKDEATTLYLWYDADADDNDDYVGDTTDAVTHNVWDSNFKGVWHMAQDPGQDAPNAMKDSTVNANEGTSAGSMGTTKLVSGPIGMAIDFDGSNDYISMPDHASLDITGALTIEAIFKSEVAPPFDGLEGVVAKWSTVSPDRSYMLGLKSTKEHDSFLSSDGANGDNRVTATAPTDNNYHYVADVFVPSTSLTLYVDGVLDNQEDTDIIGSIFSSSAPLWLGLWTSAGSAIAFFDGILDEVRISNIARSVEWIEVNSASLFDSLVTFGEEEVV